VENSLREARKSLARIDCALAGSESGGPAVQVVVKRRPSFPVASIRAKLKHYADIETFECQLLREVPVECRADVRGVLWHRCADSGSLEGEPFIALKRPVPRRSVYDIKELPSATVAAAYSGPEEASAERVYQSIREWMAAGRYRLAGPKREIYLEGMLEIQFPLGA